MFGYGVQVSRMLPCALSTVLVAQALCSKALSDKEEWVSMIGRALGAFDGRAHADAVGKGSAAVSLSYFVYLWACKSTPVECSADSRLKNQHHLCCIRRLFASWHGRSWVWLQVRDAMKTLEGLTATARTDGMRPLEVLCILIMRVVLHPSLVILT